MFWWYRTFGYWTFIILSYCIQGFSVTVYRASQLLYTGILSYCIQGFSVTIYRDSQLLFTGILSYCIQGFSVTVYRDSQLLFTGILRASMSHHDKLQSVFIYKILVKWHVLQSLFSLIHQNKQIYSVFFVNIFVAEWQADDIKLWYKWQKSSKITLEAWKMHYFTINNLIHDLEHFVAK